MRPFCAVLLCCLVIPALAQVDARGLLLAGFETPEELGRWQKRTLTDLEQTSRWSAEGSAAAAITYHAWSEGKEEWPAIIANLGAGLSTTDFTPFDALQFTVLNPGEAPQLIKLHMADSGGRRYSNSFACQPGTETVCRVPVADIGAQLNPADVRTLHFFVTRPESTYTLYVDDLRLTADVLGPAQALVARLRGLEAAVSATPQPVLRGLSGERRQRVRHVSTLRAQAEGVLARAQDGTPGTWAGVREARERVARLDREADGLAELALTLRARQHALQTGADRFVLATETSMQKVFLPVGKFRSSFATRHELSAARNEHESCQVVVFPVADLRNVSWRMTSLYNEAGDAVPASARLVGYVETKQPSYPVDFNGWWPDPLLDFQSSVDAVPEGEVLPLWVTVDVPSDAKAGRYRGILKVWAEGARAQQVEIACTVRDFAIPKHTHLRTALSWRGHLGQLYPKDQIEPMTRKYQNWMLEEYYLNPNNIYAGPPVEWDAERLRELMRLGLNAINLAYFNAPTGADFKEDAYWKSFEQRVQWIKNYLPVVEEAGGRDLCFIYCFDERPSTQLDVVFETAERLKEIWPDIEVMTTAYDRTFGLERENGHAMDIWVPLTPHFDDNASRIAEARAQGRDIWWYICIGPKHPFANWFVEWPAIEARLLMGAMTAKYEPGGFLYYAVNRWPLNDRVITSGPRTDWNPASFQINNGDGSIFCAGPNGPLATIRLENIRDGIEDYEYYLLLRELLAKRGEKAETGWVPANVVQDLSHFTYDPQVLYAERERVARQIERLSR